MDELFKINGNNEQWVTTKNTELVPFHIGTKNVGKILSALFLGTAIDV